MPNYDILVTFFNEPTHAASPDAERQAPLSEVDQEGDKTVLCAVCGQPISTKAYIRHIHQLSEFVLSGSEFGTSLPPTRLEVEEEFWRQKKSRAHP
jgi:hypothetical protein